MFDYSKLFFYLVFKNQINDESKMEIIIMTSMFFFFK
jgi:hypothetical protein